MISAINSTAKLIGHSLILIYPSVTYCKQFLRVTCTIGQFFIVFFYRLITEYFQNSNYHKNDSLSVGGGGREQASRRYFLMYIVSQCESLYCLLSIVTKTHDFTYIRSYYIYLHRIKWKMTIRFILPVGKTIKIKNINSPKSQLNWVNWQKKIFRSNGEI